MTVQKLTTTDAFVLRDLEGAPAIGVVRCAPKILVDGATWLARSVTYACASFEIRSGGASAGINAKGPDRAEAIAAFDAEVAPLVAEGLVLDAAKGLGVSELPQIVAADPRPAEVRAAAPELLAAGILAAARTAAGDAGAATFAIEGIDAMGPGVAAALLAAIGAAGGSVVGLSTATGSVSGDSPLDFAVLGGAVASGDYGSVVGEDAAPANRLLGATADVLLVGSKAGALEHNGAAYVKSRVVVPWGSVGVTAKALAVLRRAGVVVVPDFLATAGPLLGWAPDATAGPDGAAVADRISASLADVLGHEHGPVLGACLRAEAFLSSWTDQKPFGRPLA